MHPTDNAPTETENAGVKAAGPPLHRLSASVVIPAYNAECFVGGAVQSALNQTLAPLEVVVVDDGSTDGTAQVARAFGEKVRYVRQDNAGPSRARNRGIQEARGEFIAFLDADDEWLPHHLEEAARVLTGHTELEWFCGSFERRGHQIKGIRRREYDGPLREEAYIDDYFKAQATSCFAWTGAMVVRKRALVAAGGFDETMSHGEDLELWFRIALKHPQIGHSRKATAVYRVTPGSITVTDTKASSRRLLRFIEKLDRSAGEAPDASRRRSQPLITAWIGRLIRRAIGERDQGVLRAVRTRYSGRLGLPERALLLATRVVPCPMLQGAFEIASKLKRLCTRRTARGAGVKGRHP